MPEPKARIQNAHDRALATVAGLPEDPPDEETPEPEEEEKALPETATAAATERSRKHWDQTGGEDFFAYLRSINPEEQRNITLKVSAVNQDGSTGGLLRNVTGGWDMVDENWLREQFGVGKYKVELKTPPKSGRRNDWTRVQIGTDDEIKAEATKKGASKGQASAEETNQAVDVVASAAEKGMGFLGKSYEKALEVRQNGSDPMIMAKALAEMGSKGPDTGALLAGLASIIGAIQPKKDDEGQKLLFTMLEGQRKDAERRAEQAEKDADRREQRAKEEAERREREADRRAQDAKAEADRQRERDKEFFGILLKQSESKADSLNQMTGLLTSFMKAKEMIDDSIGGGPKGPWDLVAGVADSVLQQGPAIVAALKGAPPAQVEQMRNPAPAPAEPQPFYDMVIRLAKYFGRDPQLYDGHYLCQMLEEEYGPVYSDIINQPKEAVLNAIGTFEPFGKAIMEHPQAGPFMGKVIDAIKFPDTMDDIFGGEEEDDEKEPILVNPAGVATNPRQRKINGRVKAEAEAS